MGGLWGGGMRGKMDTTMYTVGRAALRTLTTPDDCTVQTEGPAQNHHVIARP